MKVCRACEKRQVPDRSERRKNEDPEVTKALADLRRQTDSLCCECALALSSARIDQLLAYMKEKVDLGQCLVRNCSESAGELGRCDGHRHAVG